MDTSTSLAFEFVGKLNQIIIFPTLALLSAVALLLFVYGCLQYAVRSGDPAARQEGVKHITWGIIGLVVMLSAYTILMLFASTFGLKDELETANTGGAVSGGAGGGGAVVPSGGAGGGGAVVPSAGSGGSGAFVPSFGTP